MRAIYAAASSSGSSSFCGKTDGKIICLFKCAAVEIILFLVAAHLTKQIIFPSVFPQNEDDPDDEAAAYIARISLEWNARKSNYEQTFLYAVISGLVNPVSYYKVDY